MTTIKFELDGVTFGGSFVVDGDILRVTGIQGRSKATHLGSAVPEELAEFILGEITREAMGLEPDGLETIEIELNMDEDIPNHT